MNESLIVIRSLQDQYLLELRGRTGGALIDSSSSSDQATATGGSASTGASQEDQDMAGGDNEGSSGAAERKVHYVVRESSPRGATKNYDGAHPPFFSPFPPQTHRWTSVICRVLYRLDDTKMRCGLERSRAVMCEDVGVHCWGCVVDSNHFFLCLFTFLSFQIRSHVIYISDT